MKTYRGLVKLTELVTLRLELTAGRSSHHPFNHGERAMEKDDDQGRKGGMGEESNEDRKIGSHYTGAVNGKERVDVR